MPRRALLIAAITGLALSVVLVYYFFANNPDPSVIVPQRNNPATTAIPSQPTAGLPVRLKIPVLNLDAAVEQLGLTADGSMDAPKGPVDVAWYKLGQRPGGTGSAVIAGHSNWNKGAPAVFDNIKKLHRGDKLYIVDDKGQTAVFAVRELRDYNQNDDAASVFGSSDGQAHLNLITCEGAWNKVTKSYNSRLVVFADKQR